MPKAYRVLIGIMSLEGCRTVEMHQLKVEDIVRQGIKTGLQVSAKRASRIVPLTDNLASWLDEYLQMRRKVLRRKIKPESYVFVSLSNNSKNRQLSRRSIRAIIDRYLIESETKIELEVRCIEILAAHVSHELKEKAYSVLANRLGISAISKSNSTFLYAFTSSRVDSVPIDEDNLKVTLKNSDRIEILKFSNPEDRPLIAQLIERQFVISVGQRTDLWRLSDSRRKWYEPKPFKIISGIGAYRRYELSAIPIDNALALLLNGVLALVRCRSKDTPVDHQDRQDVR